MYIYTDEGPDPLCHVSIERVMFFETWILEDDVGLLRSPPSTTLVAMLTEYLQKKIR